MANDHTAREAFNRIRWDPRLRAEAFVVGYVDRAAPRGMGEKPLLQWEDDIPIHRVLYLRCEQFMFWHRDADRQSSGALPACARIEAEGQPAHRIGHPTASASAHLRLYSWNVLAHGGADDGRRHEAICQHLAAWDADVIVLQEVTPPLLERLCATLAGWISERPPGASLHPHGVVIFARRPFTFEARQLTAHKRALVARLESGPRVATVHLPSDRAADAATLRRDYLGAVLAWLGEGDCALAGDLNARGDELDAVVRAHDWRDAWTGGDGFTYDPRSNARAAATSRSGRAARFDRVLLRGTWRALEARVVGGGGLSDHEAIAVTLEATAGEKTSAGDAARGDPVRQRPAAPHRVLSRAGGAAGREVPSTLRAPPVHQSAVAIIPPHDLWGPIQAIRRRFDRQIGRWMPHINLLYGFVPETAFEDAAPVLERALAAIEPFEVSLDDYDFFSHRRDVTAWLRPLPSLPLERLEAALVACFPQCVEQRRDDAFTPHLSVGRFVSSSAALDVLPEWTPLMFLVDHVALISRRGDDPFEVRVRVPLGTPLHRLPQLSDADRARREQAVEVVRMACGTLGASLELAGSMRLGTDVPGSDIDVVCQGTLARQAFFAGLAAALGCGATVAADARVPVLRLSLPQAEGLLMEVQYVDGDDTASLHAAQAPRESDALLAAVRAVMPIERFRKVVRWVRSWADARGILGQRWGFLGTYSWTVVAAWACVTVPIAGDDLDCFRHVLSMAAGLPEGDPMGLDVTVFHRGPHDRVPVLTTLPPARNSAASVTRSTARITRAELRRAAQLAAEGRWAALLAPAGPTGRRLEVPSDQVTGRDILRLILALEKKGEVRPWPGRGTSFFVEVENSEDSLAIARAFAEDVRLVG